MQLLKKFKLRFLGLILLLNSGMIYTAARIVNEDQDIRSLDDEKPVKKIKTIPIFDRDLINKELIFATIVGNEESVEKLINDGADVNFYGIDGNKALTIGVKKGHTKIVEILIKNGANVNFMDKFGNTPLMLAIDHDHKDIVELLINAGSNVNEYDFKRNTALMHAIDYADIDMVKLLLEKGANINAVNENGDTALIIAVKNKFINKVKTLLKAGADIDIKNQYLMTAMDYAKKNIFDKGEDVTKKAEIMKLLKDAAIKKRKENIVKTIENLPVHEYIPSVIGKLVADYAVHDYSDVSQDQD